MGACTCTADQVCRHPVDESIDGHLLQEMLARDLPAGGILVNCKENPKIMQRKVPSCLSIKYCYFS